MILTVHEDGFGYDAQGQRYWRDAKGCWLRAYMSPTLVNIARMPPVWTGSHARLRYVAYRSEGDNHVVICEVA